MGNAIAPSDPEEGQQQDSAVEPHGRALHVLHVESHLLGIAQLDAAQIRRSLDGDVNAVAVIMKHVGGNLRSRFADLLTTDGEKPSRDREAEFVDDFPEGEAGRAAALAAWSQGWGVLEATLASLNDADLGRTVTIRGVPHTVAKALARSLAHIAYHQGQITLLARLLVGPAAWKTITIPRGGTAKRHAEMGFDPSRQAH